MNKNKQNILTLIKTGLLTLVVLFLLYSLLKNFIDYQKKITFYDDYKKDLQKEQDKNNKLKTEIIKNQDYYTVEKNIRKNLNLLQNDETAIIIARPTPSPTTTPTPATSIPQQWRRLFLGTE